MHSQGTWGECDLVRANRDIQFRVLEWIELAGENPNALGRGTGSFRKLYATTEGQAVTRLVMGAELKRTAGFEIPGDGWWPAEN